MARPELDFEDVHRPHRDARRYRLTIELEAAPGNRVSAVRVAAGRELPVPWEWRALDTDGCVRGTTHAWLDEAQAAGVETHLRRVLTDCGVSLFGSLVYASLAGDEGRRLIR